MVLGLSTTTRTHRDARRQSTANNLHEIGDSYANRKAGGTLRSRFARLWSRSNAQGEALMLEEEPMSPGRAEIYTEEV